MSTSKAALKAIGAAIKAQNYDEVIEQSQKLVLEDPKSYKGKLSLGFALDKLSRYDDAEKAYDAATKLKEYDPQAWQGLVKIFEKQSSGRASQYQRAALKLAEIYMQLDDKYRCQDVIDKFLGWVKREGTKLQYRQALEIVLPTSPIYNYLEGRIPHPSRTYQDIAQITEFEEKERINREIGERRTRLGAKIGKVTVEVKREVLRDSDLEDIYRKIIDWTLDDEIRRQYEEKLLQRCLETLTVLPPGQERNEERAKVLKLATDIVIIKHPFKQAWDVAIEWRDPKEIQDLDASILREYCTFFPMSGLTQVLRGYLSSEISPFPPPSSTPVTQAVEPPEESKSGSDDSDDDEGGGISLARDTLLNGEDRLVVMIEGMSDAPKSILAHRLMGQFYQFLDEHESVVELMRNARRLVGEEATRTGVSFQNSSEAITSLLGTALVFYQSPKNHPEAKVLFQDLLIRDATSTPALIGIGLIFEEEEDFASATDFLERALQRDGSNVRIRTEAAWVKALAGGYERGKDELEACLPRINGKDLQSRELLAQTQYRIGMCLWNLDTSNVARKDRSGAYSYFLAALKSNLNYAPAYTSVGLFYADYSKDKKRARKCFQKAFELSPSEFIAAERLATIFASQSEWELVEAVAQRVVDSGKVKPVPGSKKKGISWPFAALGVAELNKQDYAKSIVSFQSALRIAPNDYNSWVGLGEVYHHLGRYVAATKAFQHAEQFEEGIQQEGSGETWFAKHMLANVRRELGEYEKAIDGYKSVLETRPGETGVAIALIQTLVESAWDGIDKGLFGYAAERAKDAIQRATKLANARSDAFNLWRAVGDACSIFSWIQDKIHEFPFGAIEEVLHAGESRDAFDVLSEIDGVSGDIVFAKVLYPKDEQEGLDLTRCLHAAILAHKRAIQAAANDSHARAVAYFNLGWAEYRAHGCLMPVLKKRSTRYLKAAVRCFKRAIEYEAGNSEFWNALGVVTSEINPSVAQHSFVRSLFLNERSAQTWTNLASLYLLQNDIKLANDAFTRAQSIDPDFAHAWVGQGMIALMTDNPKEADLLFTHAMEISESSSLITKNQFCQAAFDHILSAKITPSAIDLVQPIFALQQIHSMDPKNISIHHLSALFLERIDDLASSVKILAEISSTVEADYEVTESPASLSRYALAKADLARSQLAVGQYSDAIESGDIALQLSADDAGNELSAESRQICRLSAHLTAGLAHYYSNYPKSALEYFEPALEESTYNPDAVCLFAQVLWASEDETSRIQARDMLFNSTEKNPEHVQSIILLGIVALLDHDAESLDAAETTLEDLRATHSLTEQEQAEVGEVLHVIAIFSGDDAETAVLTEAQTAVVLHPNQSHGWGQLADIPESGFAMEMALKTALKAVSPHSILPAGDLSNAFIGTGKAGDIQRGLFVRPWGQCSWTSLIETVAS
ncbi:hypothetical protein BJ878DRAFT_153891 [Calycina marina]|uniref:Superkiller protein 3 n=1 Tax=Calycina marina TaxID=1763456 RepID=A0A9P8CDN1_9HELO|nr:hypothetical protein BJ878DRAFT_153891 [Calycina marina]